MIYEGIIQRYRDDLPLGPDVPAVALGEGNTPLIKVQNIPLFQQHDLTVYLKFEGLNPTGSFKDRGMTVAVTQAHAEGAKALVCASTGNTSAAAAAYGARAGMAVFVLIPEGQIALGKLAQAAMHGAHILQIQGNFDDGMAIVKEMAGKVPVAIVNSINPYRLEGQKTAAFEIIDALGRAPDYHCLPVGNAGNISAYWMGYKAYHAAGKAQKRPKMLGFQAAGAAPFIHGAPVAAPETVATAIRIGAPQSWDLAKAAAEESGGGFAAHDDAIILETQKQLASHEGVFCEPASAASVAGLMAEVRAGKIPSGSTCVCTLTGHGLKDPDIAIAQNQNAIQTVAAEFGAVRQAILKRLPEH